MSFLRPLVCLSFFFSTAAWAAPALRLDTSAVRTKLLDGSLGVWIQQGSNGPTNVFFEAYNAGDGALTPQVKGSYAWLTPAADTARPCSFDASKSCRPIRVLFSSSSLAAGAYSGVVTVSDANAFDSPQSVRVTAYVSGNTPARLDFYLPPDGGANNAATFQTPGAQGTKPPILSGGTQTGGNWLLVSSSGLGSFQFVYTHKVQATVQSGMAAGDYNGSVTVSGSGFTADNKAIPVTLHVTGQPIARPGVSQLRLRAIEGGAAAEPTVAMANGGRGTLTLSGVTPSGGSWLTATLDGTNVKVKADPAGLSPGFYIGSLSIASNAANNPAVVPVEFEVQAAGAPLVEFSSVVDAASFLSPVGGGALASLFGSQLATSTVLAPSIPLPTSLGDATVFVNDTPAPLIFVSPGQINFQMPFEVSGAARVRVDRQGQRGNTVTAAVGRRGPGLYGFSGTPYGIVVNASRGGGAVVFAWPDIPALAGVAKAPARPGDFLVIYGSGLGPVSPAVATGAAAGSDQLSNVIDKPQVVFGIQPFGRSAVPIFAGLTPGFVGLYQVNVQVPSGLASSPGTAVALLFPDGTFSNTVEIAVESPPPQ